MKLWDFAEVWASLQHVEFSLRLPSHSFWLSPSSPADACS